MVGLGAKGRLASGAGRAEKAGTTPPEPAVGSPGTHAGGWCCHGVASSRSHCGLPQGVEDLPIQQLVPQPTSVTPRARIASVDRGSLRDQNIDLA